MTHLEHSLDLVPLLFCLRDVLRLPEAALDARRQPLCKPGVLEDTFQADAVRRVGSQGLADEVLQFSGGVGTVWEAKFPPTSSACASEIASK